MSHLERAIETALAVIGVISCVIGVGMIYGVLGYIAIGCALMGDVVGYAVSGVTTLAIVAFTLVMVRMLLALYKECYS